MLDGVVTGAAREENSSMASPPFCAFQGFTAADFPLTKMMRPDRFQPRYPGQGISCPMDPENRVLSGRKEPAAVCEEPCEMGPIRPPGKVHAGTPANPRGRVDAV
jgi:hypothetical protein